MSEEDEEFKVVVAIDFGTDGLGVAYAFGGNIFVHDRWKSKRYGSVVKPKTIILLDDEGEITAVGMDAKHAYMSLTDKDRDEWMLFDRFKMALYDNSIMDDEKADINTNKIGIKSELIAINGKTCPSEKIFIAAFQHLNTICKKYLKKNKIKVTDSEIQWIISVPAIWNDDAKNKMKSWAIKSGLINKNILNQCKIVYEPDCAALALQYHAKQANNIHYDKDKNNFHEGKTLSFSLVKDDKYILVDAGGGTVDVACHEYYADFSVKEILKPSGGNWGSVYIDDEYIKLLQEIFSQKWMDEFRKAAPNNYVELIHNFQTAKCTFYKNQNDKSHNVELPFTFLSFIEEKINNKIKEDECFKLKYKNVTAGNYTEHFINNAVVDYQKCLVSIKEDNLLLDASLWKRMFDVVVNPIVNHIENLLKQINKTNGECKYLCLVGGLSCSCYFQSMMKNKFSKLKIIVPEKPILAVVEGAAYFGITKKFVRSRISKYSYGVICCVGMEEALNRNMPRDYIESHTIFNKAKDINLVKGGIDILVNKNEEILIDEIKTMRFSRVNPDEKYLNVHVFCSDQRHPKTMVDGKRLGHITLKFDGDNFNDSKVMVEFHFGDTSLKIYAYPAGSPQHRQLLELKYVSEK